MPDNENLTIDELFSEEPAEIPTPTPEPGASPEPVADPEPIGDRDTISIDELFPGEETDPIEGEAFEGAEFGTVEEIQSEQPTFAQQILSGERSIMPSEVSIPGEIKEAKFQAFAQGGLEGITMGFSDEISAMRQVAQLVDAGQISREDAVKEYRTIRDEIRRRADKLREENGFAYTGGQVLGAVVSTVIPILRAGSLGARTLIGAMQGLGISSAELTGEDVEIARALKDSGAGGLTAAVLPPVTAGTAKALGVGARGIKSVAQNTREKAADFAERAAGFMLAKKRQIEKVRGRRETGKALLDSDIIHFMDDFESLANRAIKREHQLGEEIGETITSADVYITDFPEVIQKEFLPKPGHIARRIRFEVLEDLQNSSVMEGVAPGAAKRIARLAEKFEDTEQDFGFMLLTELQREKKLLTRMIKESNFGKDAGIPTDTLKAVRAILREEEDKAVGRILSLRDKIGTPKTAVKDGQIVLMDSELEKVEKAAFNTVQEMQESLASGDKTKVITQMRDFIDLKRMYGVISDLSEAAGDKANRIGSNNVFSLTDFLAGGAGATAGAQITGDPVSAMLIGGGALVARKIARERGASSAAVVLDKLSKAADNTSILLGDISIPLKKLSGKTQFNRAMTMALADEQSPIAIRGYMPIDGAFLEFLKEEIKSSDDLSTVEKASFISKMATQIPVASFNEVKESSLKNIKTPQTIKEIVSAMDKATR